jgi:hypothetical protein
MAIDAGFLSGWYIGKLFMIYAYDAVEQLLPLTFTVVACEESIDNWG